MDNTKTGSPASDNSFKLRPGMLLGTASSATQVDGGDFNHTWNDWYNKGHIKDASNPADAANHWRRWREDVLLMRKMGLQTCRMSVEWARVEPEEGVFDGEAIAHVKEELMLLIGLGIKPLVTLHHFTNPMWFEEKGGWEDYGNVMAYLRYVEKMASALGHLVSEYITINEPNVYALSGYMAGVWPPGKRSPAAAVNVISNLAAAHIKAYRLIHDMRRSMGFRDTKVSFANHMRVFTPKNPKNPLCRTACEQSERFFQGVMTRAMVTGEFKSPLKNHGRDRRGSYCDFHALNYYSRTVVSLAGVGTAEGCYKNDLGWEIYPHGIVECCKMLYELAPLPIYITENGTCDLSDSFRSRFIYEHLRELCRTKLPVKRYYHWCFTDNFEWLEGNYARFGIVNTNFETMERTVKRSGEFYSKIIKNRGVSEELYNEYVAGESYHY